MSSTKAYLELVSDRLSALEGLTFRPMMGEYLLYWQGQLFGGVYDDRLLLKPTPSARALLPEAELIPPYAGARPLLAVPDMEDKEQLAALIRTVCAELPPPKKRKT